MYFTEKQTQQTLNIIKVYKYNIGGNMRAHMYTHTHTRTRKGNSVFSVCAFVG